MDCRSHEGPTKGDARFLYLGRAHTEGDVFVYLPKEKAVVTGDMVEAVREEAALGATLAEVQRRVPDRLAPTYEKPFSTYGDYRPWRAGLLRYIERTDAMVS